MDILQAKISITQYRDNILSPNCHNYDIESEDTIKAMEHRPDKIIELLQRLWKRAMVMSRFNLYSTHPRLLRLVNEDPADYMERCSKRFNK